MKTRIHVNQHNIKANAKGANLPVLTVKTYLTNTLCNGVEFTSGRVVYAPDKPLSCGARVWIETDEPVTILREAT
jgi:RNA 3'-terminal phosphate cyclase